MTVHPTAIIDPTAALSDQVTIGPYCIIGKQAKIGPRTILHAHVVIDDYTVLGTDNRIYPGAVIGAPPQDLRWKGEFSQVVVGNGNVIRECVTLHRGTGGENTVIGNENYLMAYTHAGHNVKMGNGSILANTVQLAGHVELEDKVNIGGIVGIHQFVRIGTLSMVGGMSRIAKDIPPYVKSQGNPARVYGLNVVGLRRAGIPSERREKLKKAYNLVYRSKLNLAQAISEIEKSLELADEVRHFVDFLKNASRQGILSREDAKVAIGEF